MASRLDYSVSNAKFEREFLISLAPIWLACRWRLMGNPLAGRRWPKPDLMFDYLGTCDYGYEMELIAREELNARRSRCSK